MLHSTRGIVFHQIKYAESSIIVKIYTELFGLQSYIVRGIRSKKSRIKPGLFQHLSLVDLVVYHKEKKDIQEIKEIKINRPFKSIPNDIRKGTIIIFINEILSKVIREQEANEPLFDFIYRTVEQIDLMEKSIGQSHLLFMVELTRFLGFAPINNFSQENSVFDLMDGKFTNRSDHPDYFVEMPQSNVLSKLIKLSSKNNDDFMMTQKERTVNK